MEALYTGLPGEVEQDLCAEDVRLNKDPGIHDRSVDMRLRRKVYDIVKPKLLKERRHGVLIRDVSLSEDEVTVFLRFFQILNVTGVRKIVDTDYQIQRMLLKHMVHKVGTDKTGGTGYQIFHVIYLVWFVP